MKKIGVLAMQGAFVEHIAALRRLEAEAVPVRLPREFKGLSALVIPGGESTTIGKLMREYSLVDELKKLIAKGFPIMGTCAGMILLAKQVRGLRQRTLEVMDIEVRRNAFGRQVDSFEADLEIPVLGKKTYRAIFIRAPLIEGVGPGARVLARLPEGIIVAAQQNNLLVSSFHPELTDDLRFHRYFLDLTAEYLRGRPEEAA